MSTVERLLVMDLDIYNILINQYVLDFKLVYILTFVLKDVEKNVRELLTSISNISNSKYFQRQLTIVRC